MTIKVFYNEIDPFCCSWLSNLMDKGWIRPGTINDHSIVDLRPEDVRGYELAHFFAGIAGWDYAFTLANWAPDGRVWWTGSCPCQPFSAAGKGQAGNDLRHLWPHWFRLIRECRPQRVLGEQVASAAGHGWLDVVSTDLEAEAYTVGAVVLGAHSVGAPHQRQRLWFVADRGVGEDALRLGRRGRRDGSTPGDDGEIQTPGLRGLSAVGELDDAPRHRPEGGTPLLGCDDRQVAADGRQSGDLADAERRPAERHGYELGVASSGDQSGAQERQRLRFDAWDGCEFITCRDGKSRPVPVEPGLFPLAYGVPNRVGLLRGFGNAIVPQVAAAFIRAYLECEVTR